MSYLKITLSCPAALGEQVVEYLLDANPATGFTSFAASGHGRDFAQASVREQVRGRVDARVVMLVVAAAEAPGLLAALRQAFPTPHLVYWTEAVQDFGDFG